MMIFEVPFDPFPFAQGTESLIQKRMRWVISRLEPNDLPKLCPKIMCRDYFVPDESTVISFPLETSTGIQPEFLMVYESIDSLSLAFSVNLPGILQSVDSSAEKE